MSHLVGSVWLCTAVLGSIACMALQGLAVLASKGTASHAQSVFDLCCSVAQGFGNRINMELVWSGGVAANALRMHVCSHRHRSRVMLTLMLRNRKARRRLDRL